MKVKRYILLVLVVALSAAATGGIYIFITHRIGGTGLRVIGTSIALAVLSLTGLSCAVWLEKKKLLPLGYVGVAVSGLTCLIIIWLIWNVNEHPGHVMETVAKLCASGVVLSLAMAYGSLLLLLIPSSRLVENIAFFTLGCLSIISIMLIGMVWFEWQTQERFWRTLGVFVILLVLGTLLVPLVRKLQMLPKSGD